MPVQMQTDIKCARRTYPAGTFFYKEKPARFQRLFYQCFLEPPLQNGKLLALHQIRLPLKYRTFQRQHVLNTIKVLGGGGVGEETLLQKDPSPTEQFNATFP